MTRAIRLDLMKKTIMISDYFFKRSKNPNSREFRELNAVIKDHPDFNVIVEETTKKKKNSSRPKLKIEQMKTYIHRNHPEDEEFFDNRKNNFVLRSSIYKATLDWFYDRYKDDEEIKAILKSATEEQKEEADNTTVFSVHESAAAPESEKIGA